VRALLIGNSDDLDPGFVGLRFRERGYAFTELHRDRPGHWTAPPADVGDVELVLTLGSEWNVYRSEISEAVEAEAALYRRAIDRRVPLFAICFGAQVLSHALGGTVSRMGQPDIGWRDVEFAGERLDGVPPGPWMEWHYDTFTVPEGFSELARSSSGPELVVGRRALATQFHPEATETVITRWLSMGGEDQLRERGGDPEVLRAETRANAAASRASAAALVDWFLAWIGSAGGDADMSAQTQAW
jgi:GMP synthase-like glutamine amidotransferase